MKSTILLALPIVAAFAGCDNNPPANTGDMAMNPPDLAMMVTDPPKPALAGTQIERMGRATINVAVTNPFDLDYSMQLAGATNVNTTRDLHSKDSDPSMWRMRWTAVHARTLALYDGLDGTCGNQFGACGKFTGCAMGDPATMRYQTLAGVLADDQLYLDTTKTDCSFYLGVEAAVLQVPGANTFCGGRTPAHDTVDTMYSAAAVGVAAFPNMMRPTFLVTDGVAREAEMPVDDPNVFPFLSAPQ